MGLLKSPLLSLDARGTIGDTLTLQKRGQATIIRRKPTPAYRYTLPQAYQRWLYEDYAYLWRQQSVATKQRYATAGSRHHLTGFQYWMKVMLLTMPDIVGWWRLDEKAGAIAYDSSQNNNNGTIIGVSPATGLINGGYFFDGVNDKIVCPNPPSAALITLESCIYPTAYPFVEHGIFFKGLAPPATRAYSLKLTNTGNIIFYCYTGALQNVVTITAPISLNNWYHVLATYDGVNHSQIFVNDTLELNDFGTIAGPIVDLSTVFSLGAIWTGDWFKGYQDNSLIFNRVLDRTEITRHSKRRYPA